MTVRNLREWRTLGLLPKAKMRGRVGYYDADVVARVERVKELHAEGFTLELIARLLDAGDEVVRLAETLRAPVPGVGARLGETLAELGLDEDEAFARIQADAERMAASFEQLWMERVWEPFVAAGMPEDQLAEIQATAARVKPLALEIVIAAFSRAMDAQIERGIARELRGVTSPRG